MSDPAHDPIEQDEDEEPLQPGIVEEIMSADLEGKLADKPLPAAVGDGDPGVYYPGWVESDDEQRRAFVLSCIGNCAGDLSKEAMAEFVIFMAEVLRVGEIIDKNKKRHLRPVT